MKCFTDRKLRKEQCRSHGRPVNINEICVRERRPVCYPSNMARRDKCSFEMLSWQNRGQTAQALLLQLFLLALPFRNLERQTGNWGIGCWTTGLCHGQQEEGLQQGHKGLSVPESSAVWQPLSWMHIASLGGRGAKKTYRLRSLMHQGWHIFYTCP